MDFDKALDEFGKAVGNLKRAYSDKYNQYTNNFMVIVDEDDYVTIVPTNTTDRYTECCREWINTDEQ